MIREGMIVRIGYDEELIRSAVGLEFRVREVKELAGGKLRLEGEVVNNPNGWHADSVSHTYRPSVDKIVGGIDNEDAVLGLPSTDDFT